MNEEEKNAIDFLKETNFDYLEYDMCVSSVEIISNLVERLQKENEELKNQEATQRKINELLVQRYSNSISVQKVKDKIEEILNNGEYRIIFEGDAEFPDKATCIDAQKYIKLEKLQELLEGRK
jgi:hypothetical protein|nr:MAG TPA: hypothetical protein [Caudoviricetes sp.]